MYTEGIEPFLTDNSVQVIFFDLDDTLYERCGPFRAACKTYLDLSDRELTHRAYKACSKRGDEVFLPAQRGQISMEEMYIYRYTKGFADVGITVSPDMALAFTAVYKKAQTELILEPSIAGMLDRCRDHGKRMGLISNGPGPHQRVKTAALGLEAWMEPDLILISGELGTDKPDPQVFRIAEKRAGVPGHACLMVGDSEENDIRPAAAQGWRTLQV